MFVTATANKLDQKLIPGVGFCCAEPDNVAFGEDCGGFGLFGREKPLSVSELFCRTLEEKTTEPGLQCFRGKFENLSQFHLCGIFESRIWK